MPWKIEKMQVGLHVRDVKIYANGNSEIATEEESQIWEYVQRLEKELGEQAKKKTK